MNGCLLRLIEASDLHCKVSQKPYAFCKEF